MPRTHHYDLFTPNLRSVSQSKAFFFHYEVQRLWPLSAETLTPAQQRKHRVGLDDHVHFIFSWQAARPAVDGGGVRGGGPP